MDRLAKLHYTLLPDSALAPWQTWWSPYGIEITGVVGVTPGTSVGLSLLAVLTKVLGVPLSKIAFYPLIPLFAIPATYLLSTRILDRRTAIIPVTFVVIYAGAFYTFQEYVFGRYVLFPLFLSAVIWFLLSSEKRFLILSLLFLLGLKFTAPGTEIVALISVIIITVLYSYTGKQRGSVPLAFMILITIVFLAINPKLYFGALLGIFNSGNAVTLQLNSSGGGILPQLMNAFNQLLSMFTGSTSTPHPLRYGGTQPTVAGRARTGIVILLAMVTGIFSLHQLVSVIRTRVLSFRFVLVIGLLIGISMNVLFRAVLLGRFGPKGLLVVLPIAAFIAIRTYFSPQQAQAIGAILLLILGGAVIMAHGPVTQSFVYDQGEKTASWQSKYTEKPQSNLVDFQTSSNLEYYYADQRESEYWKKYKFVDFNATIYKKLIEGERVDADYLIIDQDTRYPVKPQSYGALEPLEGNLNKIGYSNQLSKVYSNGDHTIRQFN